MKLNLPKYQCVRFELRAECPVPDGEEQALQSLVAQTSHHEHDPTEPGRTDSVVGIFGSKFLVGGAHIRSLANLGLDRRDDLPWARVWLLNSVEDETLTRPPRSIKPVSLLMQAATTKFAPTAAECSAVFEYNQLEGWTSKLQLPSPVIAQVDPYGITHIEMAEFSNRDDDGVNYRIEVRQDEERGVISHTVRFEQPLDWSRRSLQRLFNHGRTISGRLMMQQGHNHYGTDTH